MLILRGRMPGIPSPRLQCRAVLIALLISACAGRSAAAPLTLEEAERLALLDEPGRAALLARADAFAANATVVGELPDPTLRVGLNNYPIESGDFTTEGMTSAGLAYRQSFPGGSSRAYRRDAMSWQATAFQRNADARDREVLLAVRRAWLDAWYWDRAQELIAGSRPFFADLADITRSLYSVGRKSQQDVLRAELELSRLDDRLLESERQRSAARAMLGEWVGDAAMRPVTTGFPTLPPLPPPAALEQALATHPLLDSADAQLEASRAEVRYADERSKPGWALDVAYSYRDGALPDGDPRSDFITLGVTVDLPWFRRRSVDATLAAALANESAAEAGRERLRRRLSTDLAAEYARWDELGRRVELYDTRILDQSAATAEASLLAYQSDTADFADVMRAYIDELDTRIDALRLRVERARSQAQLASLGGF